MGAEVGISLGEVIVIMGWSAGIVMLILFILFLQDIMQSTHAVRRNFPVIGRMRYFLEEQGEFFRQYFFAHDREEMPFNRATRNWVYRAAKGLGTIIGFGSSNDLRQPGSVIFVNSPYPHLAEEEVETPPHIIGDNRPKPFVANHVFNISGMSFGALSEPAVRALSKGASGAGIWMNTGEGGLSPYHLSGDCDIVYQIGTAKFGVCDDKGELSDERLKEVASQDAVKMFEIKLAQGAKPGKGGVLPGHKVTEEISKIRGIPVGQDALSPNRHRDIRCTDDLLDMIARVHEVTGKPVGIKIVMGSDAFARELCEAIHKRGKDSRPDFITLDGADGGSGAAPQVLADHMGLPLEESLPMLVDMLVEYGLRDDIHVIASGKLVTSSRVAWALCMGADFTVSARGFLFSLGCIQAQQCHTDRCPTGITTQNKRLQKGLDVDLKAGRVTSYANWMNKEVDMIAHSCGLTTAREFNREHARIIQTAGKSTPMNVMYPYPAKRTF